MPTFTTATERVCQRTERSCSSCQTETVCTKERERCSSFISSSTSCTSDVPRNRRSAVGAGGWLLIDMAWGSHGAAHPWEPGRCPDTTVMGTGKCYGTVQWERRSGLYGICGLSGWRGRMHTHRRFPPRTTLTLSGTTDVIPLYQQEPRALREAVQQQELEGGRDGHHC